MQIRVESYSGYTADERPLRIFLDGRAYEVEAVEDRWYSPEATWFRVKTADGRIYVLRRALDGTWTLEAFRQA